MCASETAHCFWSKHALTFSMPHQAELLERRALEARNRELLSPFDCCRDLQMFQYVFTLVGIADGLDRHPSQARKAVMDAQQNARSLLTLISNDRFPFSLVFDCFQVWMPCLPGEAGHAVSVLQGGAACELRCQPVSAKWRSTCR